MQYWDIQVEVNTVASSDMLMSAENNITCLLVMFLTEIVTNAVVHYSGLAPQIAASRHESRLWWMHLPTVG